jgi:hypothetical protein
MLEKHMTVLSTMVSLGTLAGLLGTVTGMIKAFSALSAAGTQIKLLLQMVFLRHLLTLQQVFLHLHLQSLRTTSLLLKLIL